MVLAGRSELLPDGGPDEAARRLQELVEGIRVEVLPEAGHMLHHEQPQDVARLVEAFLRQE